MTADPSGQSSLEVEVLIIGWGKAGKTLAGTLGRQGRRVAVVERSREMNGGSCINIACVPTKALIHRSATRPDQEDPATWFAESVSSRDSLVGKLRARNREMLQEVDSVTLVDGHARFVGPRRVEVRNGADRLVIDAGTVVVNTGTRPARPSIDGAEESTLVHDSTSLQHVDPLPRRLVVVGGSYVGLEFAGMFAGFGTAVTLAHRHDRLLPGEDPDVAEAVTALLADEGVEVVLRQEVDSVREIEVDGRREVVATLTGPDGPREVVADAVLVAAGREPVTDDLGLDVAGIDTDERGYIVVDGHLRTSVPGVFAVGDVNAGPQFTYVSLDDHRVVLDQLAGAGQRSATDRVAVPSTTFLTPPLARVGLNEQQARDLGRDVLVATKPVADIAAMPRPKIVGETHGLIKVLVDAETDEVLGATLLCVDAQEVVNLVALAMRAGVTATQLRDGIWTHPSTTEAFNEVLGTLRPLE